MPLVQHNKAMHGKTGDEERGEKAVVAVVVVVSRNSNGSGGGDSRRDRQRAGGQSISQSVSQFTQSDAARRYRLT